jgi:hypothetical protein
MPTYKMFVMAGKEPTKIDSNEKNYEVREFAGGLVGREDGPIIRDNLTITEAQKLINDLSAKPQN